MNETPRRKLLGKRADLAGREWTWLTADALELDEHGALIELRRRRILFDEVELVTLHRARRWALIIVMLVIAGFFTAISMAVVLFNHGEAEGRMQAGLIGSAILSSPFLAIAALQLIAGSDVITVFGRRTTARMRFLLRKSRARQVYATIGNAVRVASQKIEPVPSPEPSIEPIEALPVTEPTAG